MKLKHLVVRMAAVAAIATAVPTTAQAQLWYNGNFDGANGLYSGSTGLATAVTYDNFVVTGSGWTVNSIFGNFLTDLTWSTANYEIRTGMSVGDGGSIVAFGNGLAASQVATGTTAFGLTEYRATITGLSIFLAPGTYWLGMAPISAGANGIYVSTTSGAGGSNANIDGLALFNSAFFGANFGSSTDQGTGSNFSYGVDGLDGGQEVVPEPATMTLLATGLAGMAAARRRKAAKV